MSANSTQPAATTAPQTTQPLDAKTFWLGVMAGIFALLLGLHATQPNAFVSTATAAESVTTRDYDLVTAAQSDGNEALYVLDKRTGLLAVLLWDNQERRPVPADIEPVQRAFGAR